MTEDACYAADVGMPEYCQFTRGFMGDSECRSQECRNYNEWLNAPEDERGLIEVPHE